jgi:uncharacterized protein YeaO (DUF488 family)
LPRSRLKNKLQSPFKAQIPQSQPRLWNIDNADIAARAEGGKLIRLKRAYERPSPEDGKRILVERLWPRGMKKEALPLDDWLKEVAPSPALRRWFSHDPNKWAEFRRRYFAELDQNSGVCENLRSAARKGRICLIYSSHDTEHNAAVALKDYLERGATEE